ncbi:hypothetical protein IWZ00DRAFT_101655 [Phyllosticta capitalensis]
MAVWSVGRRRNALLPRGPCMPVVALRRNTRLPLLSSLYVSLAVAFVLCRRRGSIRVVGVQSVFEKRAHAEAVLREGIDGLVDRWVMSAPPPRSESSPHRRHLPYPPQHRSTTWETNNDAPTRPRHPHHAFHHTMRQLSRPRRPLVGQPASMLPNRQETNSDCDVRRWFWSEAMQTAAGKATASPTCDVCFAASRSARRRRARARMELDGEVRGKAIQRFYGCWREIEAMWCVGDRGWVGPGWLAGCPGPCERVSGRRPVRMRQADTTRTRALDGNKVKLKAHTRGKIMLIWWEAREQKVRPRTCADGVVVVA